VNLLVVGVSYRTGSVDLLERLAVGPDEAPQALVDLISRPFVSEAMLLSTCNRVEVYAVVSAFHGGLADIADVLAARTGMTPDELAPHMYVHFDTEAARHTFRVATGLDSMVVGEPQILGQLRDAYAQATDRDTAGRLLHELMQQALRVGKRAHSETTIDQAGQNVVEVALRLGGAEFPSGSISGRSALVVGAGSTGGLALATLRRHGAGHLLVTNRDPQRAARLAELHGATAVPLTDLRAAVDQVDLVICATAADGHVLTREHVTTPTVILDLAVPRDVDPAVADVAGVTLIDMARLATAAAADRAEKSAEEAVIDIVAAEVDAFRLQLRGADVAPTVAALRARADDLVAAELAKLRTKRPDLTDEQRSDVAQTVHRIVQRLLHTPSVRVRELAAEPGGDRYAEVLRDLFGLDVPPVVATYAEIPTVMEPVVESQSAADIPPAAGGQPVEPTVGDER
jgi:glutamyl-tRNA reductase